MEAVNQDAEKKNTDAPYPQTFAEVVHAIATNKPIQGIGHVPETVLQAQSSSSEAPLRKKPWE